MYASNLEGEFQSAAGIEEQRTGINILPQAYGFTTFGNTKLGLGAYTPFGLPMGWENPTTFSGRFSSYTANLRTININPTAAWRFGNLGVGVGVDYMFSKIQLERFGQRLSVRSAQCCADPDSQRAVGKQRRRLERGIPLEIGAKCERSLEHRSSTRKRPSSSRHR